MRTLLLICSFAFAAIGQTTKCPAPYHVVGTGCYTFPDVRGSSWMEASIFCQFSGGYLANIDSEDEQNALKEYSDILNLPGDNFRWIGATDMLSNGTFRWVPSATTVVYTDWGPGFPSTISSYNCVHWYPATNNWYNTECCTVVSNVLPLCEAVPL